MDVNKSEIMKIILNNMRTVVAIAVAACALANTSIVNAENDVTISNNTDFTASDYHFGSFTDGLNLTINPGSTLSINKMFIGASNNNTVLVSGPGAALNSPGTAQNTFVLGYGGSNNQLMISNGGQVNILAPNHTEANHDALIGFYTGSNNNLMTVTGAGSLFENDSTLYIGRLGNNNELLIDNGGHVISYNARIGGGCTATECVSPNTTNPTGNSVVVNGAGSVWDIGGKLRVGGGITTTSNNNSLSITNGGVVNLVPSTPGYSGMWVGYDANSSNNFVLVSGQHSQLNAQTIVVGAPSSSGNSITVSDYGKLKATSINYNGINGSLNLNHGAIIMSDVINSTSATNTLNLNLGSGASYAYSLTGSWTVHA